MFNNTNSDRLGDWIKLSPLERQPEPQNLEKIEEIINKRWERNQVLELGHSYCNIMLSSTVMFLF